MPEIVEFDAAAHIEKVSAKHSLEKPAAPAPVIAKTEPVPVADPVKPEPETNHIPRSVRRELNRLLQENGKLQGRLEALEKLGTKPEEPKFEAKAATDPGAKPDRKKFKDGPEGDADFAAAMGEYGAQQVLKSRDADQGIRDQIIASDKKANEDAAWMIPLLPDWEQAQKDAEADKRLELDWSAAENRQLALLLGTSKYAALVPYYWCKNPDEFVDLVKLKGAEQIAEFRALEGHLKRVYGDLRKKKDAKPAEEKKEAKTPEKDKKLPPPSQSATVKGGTAAPQKVEPMIDGKLNPVWVAQRNERRGVRQ
jgi:hypothetical protein